jgi:Right handed beta helix region
MEFAAVPDAQLPNPRPTRVHSRPRPTVVLLIPVLALMLICGAGLAATPTAGGAPFNASIDAQPEGIAILPGVPTTTYVPSSRIALDPTNLTTTTPAPTPAPKGKSTGTPAPDKTVVHHPAPTPKPRPKPPTSRPPVACGGSLQSKINAASAGSTLRLTGCSYSGSATISKALTISGGTLRVGRGSIGLRVTASNVTISGVTIVGPNKTSYNGDEFGVYAFGSAGSPIRHLTVRSSNIGNFGNDGIFAKNVAGLVVSGNTIHDIVYAGVLVISGNGGSVSGNLIERIGVHGASANENNAYGVLLTDQGGAPTSGFAVSGNTVEDVPTWHALDTHGGRQISFTNNTIRRSSRGIFITISPSGRATSVTVSGNHLLVPAPVTFNLEAVTTYDTVAVTITGNTITGWGSGQAIEDYGSMSSQLVVKNNRVQ